MIQQSQTPSGPFTDYASEDVRALIGEYPLAWVCSLATGAATHLPLIGEYDGEGQLTGLIGHFPRSMGLEEAFAADPRALILFTGPQGYVSAEMAGRTNWAPTWNFAQLRIEATITLQPERTEEALQILLDTMERDAHTPWRIANLGERYPGMLRRIVGFRADIATLEGRFKLGQDEDIETLRSILAAIRDPALLRWMQRMNRGRL